MAEFAPLPDDDEDPNESKPHPFGVPDDYTVTAPNRVGMTADALSRSTTTPPRYWTGDQNTLVRDLSPEDRGTLQVMMRQIGLISPTARLANGTWDTTSANAFKEILTWANVNGVTWREALQDMLSNSEQFGALEPQGGDLPKVSNPEDIKTVLRDTFREKVGSGLIDEAKLDAMVKAYQGEELTAQNQTSGTIVRPMDPQVFADQQAQLYDKTGYDSTKVADRFDRIAALLGGGQ